jgi:hypothetical protein
MYLCYLFVIPSLLCNILAQLNVKLLFCICRPKDIQEIILASHMGVSKLTDLLGDSREVIRNDVSWDRFQIVTVPLWKPYASVYLFTGPVICVSNQDWINLNKSLCYDKGGSPVYIFFSCCPKRWVWSLYVELHRYIALQWLHSCNIGTMLHPSLFSTVIPVIQLLTLTRECCIVLWVNFLLGIWRPLRLQGPRLQFI